MVGCVWVITGPYLECITLPPPLPTVQLQPLPCYYVPHLTYNPRAQVYQHEQSLQ
ncbi:hypothetical protein B7P43_G12444 [Cryptotermes secundus]|uniref:Uncharacterized protein n=1 Tax=Cryptotermes secundus TaxID=105785 RepID=A0A2J7PBX7_9NEOP|nr:hypothetical protein B7P43_G12444 [Cryptotermes secundus]